MYAIGKCLGIEWPIRWSEISVSLGSVRAIVYCIYWNDKQAHKNVFLNN